MAHKLSIRPFSALTAGCAALVLLLAWAPAWAGSATPFIRKVSHHSFKQTVSSLKHSAAANGMMVMGHLNQAQVLTMTGLHLPGAQSFLIGNPSVGKKLFAKNPAVGAVVPLRVFVWKRSGHTYVGYFQPSALLSAISPQLGKPGRMLNRKFSAIVGGAVH